MEKIEFDATHEVWLLHTPTTSYAFRRIEDDVLVHLYWGARICLADAVRLADPATSEERVGFDSPFDGQEELPLESGLRYGPPSLAVRFADGVRGIEWVSAAASVEEVERRAELVVPFRDRVYPLMIELHYRVYDNVDVVDRWVVLRNDGSDPGGCTGRGGRGDRNCL